MLKALGDETRFSMYRELAGSTRGCSAQELADSLGPARQHRAAAPRPPARGRSGRGRARAPGHRRPAHPRLLAGARRAGPGFRPAELHAAGRAARGARRAGRRRRRRSDRDRPRVGRRGRPAHPIAFVREGARGRDEPPRDSSPATETAGADTDMAFMHCPFRELAEAYPELVCNLHRGISEGIVAEVGGGSVEEFATLYDRDPCRVAVSVG